VLELAIRYFAAKKVLDCMRAYARDSMVCAVFVGHNISAEYLVSWLPRYRAPAAGAVA
jgi:hypothetical protein